MGKDGSRERLIHAAKFAPAEGCRSHLPQAEIALSLLPRSLAPLETPRTTSPALDLHPACGKLGLMDLLIARNARGAR